jgi:thiol-disulfide isomerase/thioredoxin
MVKFRLPILALLGGLLLGAQAPAETVDFTLPDLQGKPHKLSDYRGKWVLVNYWATWCPPCLEEIPELEVFHSNHQGKDAVVLGVNMEEIDLKTLTAFVDEQFISYPILRTAASSPGELGRVTGLPTSYLISPAGVLAARHAGPITADAIESFIRNYPATPGGE